MRGLPLRASSVSWRNVLESCAVEASEFVSRLFSSYASKQSYKHRGRNAKKQSRRCFVFPELAQQPSQGQQYPISGSIVALLLQELRVPSVALPVRYFLAKDSPESPARGQEEKRSAARQIPEWVMAVPDVRSIHQLREGATSGTAGVFAKLVARAESLRSLAALLEYSKHSVGLHPSVVAGSFASIGRICFRAAAAQHEHFPHGLRVALPHVAEAAALEGQHLQGSHAAHSVQLHCRSALSIVTQYLEPALLSMATLNELSTSQLSDVAAAVAVLQKHVTTPVAPAFWAHLHDIASKRAILGTEMGASHCNAKVAAA
jgi:hypothetical protein